MMQLSIRAGWFLLNDKWHVESMIHYVEENQSKTACGTLELNAMSIENMMYFATVKNITIGDVCTKCLVKIVNKCGPKKL